MLLYKLSKLGVSGNFFGCMKHMHTHSRFKIKLLDKLSDAIDVLVGTEQGHPMSSEFFKVFLSQKLNNVAEEAQVPQLNEIQISDLLWVDDLVLLALDGKSLQNLLDTVYYFCITWGLTVNMKKTAVLIFNKSGRLLSESNNYTYGDASVPSDNNYCHLGITLSLSWTLSLTMDELRKKGLRAYFSLKSLVDINELAVRSMFKLFDALILPVVSYGCQIWFHNIIFMKLVVAGKFESQPKESIRKISTDSIEKLHLKFLKWTLGVHKKRLTSFAGMTAAEVHLSKRSKNK